MKILTLKKIWMKKNYKYKLPKMKDLTSKKNHRNKSIKGMKKGNVKGRKTLMKIKKKMRSQSSLSFKLK